MGGDPLFGHQKGILNPPGFVGWTDYLEEQMLAGLLTQVLSIAPKDDGAMWLGTGRSLVHFDGISTFVPNMSQESLDNLNRLRVESMTYDADGGLYLGTDFGLYYLANPNSVLAEVPLEFAGGHGKTIEWVAMDQAGWLWIHFAQDRDVARWHPKTNKVERYLDNVDAVFTFIDNKGDVWIGTDGEGLFHINLASATSSITPQLKMVLG